MIKFGTGGWRAIIADGFTKENIRLLTAGLCALMEKEGHAGAEICVGYDRRFLSKESAHWRATTPPFITASRYSPKAGAMPTRK